jgi:hypothetical protein
LSVSKSSDFISFTSLSDLGISWVYNSGYIF